MNILSAPYRYYKNYFYRRFKSIRGTHLILRNLRKIAHLKLDKVEEEPQNIFEREWDNLIILDACRFDVYDSIFGTDEYRVSLGSSTKEFLEKTFSDEAYEDTVYVTGNPHVYPDLFIDITGREPEDVFFSVYNCYETDWDEESGTVLPEPIARDAISADRLFPDKRKIIHFMQPHEPFVHNKDPDSALDMSIWKDENSNLSELKKAEIGMRDRDEIRQDYRKNLELLQETLEELSENLSGKTVVTADHGELLGEEGLYGHPPRSKAKVLRKVPWNEISTD